MITLLVVIVLVLVLSGFFSGSEAALVSLTDAEVESLVHKQKIGAKMLEAVEKRLGRAVIAIVVMNNIVNIVGSILVGQIVINMYGDALLAITTTGLTFGVIVFSEIIPKTLGMHYAEQTSLVVAPIIWVLMIVLNPLISLLEWLTDMLKQGERKVGTEEQIRSLVTIGRREGHIETDEGHLIHRAFILNDKSAGDIMTGLKDIVGVSIHATAEEAYEKIDQHSFSRYPVFGSSIHDIEGIVMSKEILELLAKNRYKKPIREVMRKPLVVDAMMRSDELLNVFKNTNTHLAVVQDEGKTAGIVTLEDVLEELVGDIEDETDIED